MNNFKLIPSEIQYPAAPSVDQTISISIDSSTREITEYDRSTTLSLAQVYDDERQSCEIFRPTFKIDYLYSNTLTGTTTYIPFRNNLFYVDNENSKLDGIWKGFPQYYEFDFYRPNIGDDHITYVAKSAYTYNWTYYLSYAFSNNYEEKLFCTFPQFGNFEWVAKDGIPFVIRNSTQRGSSIISFECISNHGLLPGEYVELSISYSNKNLFQVYSLGNGRVGSSEKIFNIFNVGFTGNTFLDGKNGTFKRVINPDNLTETRSKYYVRQHKILTNLEDVSITKSGFEKNAFNEQKKFEYSSITPNQISRISQKTSSNSYNLTTSRDIDLTGIIDNQKRPVSELFLTIINKGFSGYFNQPNSGIGLKQGWEFNLTDGTNSWWDLNNVNSNTDIETESYTKTNGVTKTFYYNSNLVSGDTIDGDFCEWNDFQMIERVISPYYHKLKFNQNVFQTSKEYNTNSLGYYYNPHTPMTIRVFSDYIETANVGEVDNVPNYSFYSQSNRQFRWRDIYTYGFIDDKGRGVDYPFLNSAQYPFSNVIFRLIPEGVNYNNNLFGENFSVKPLIDECE
jgi:hypothetical protein